jgi:phage terminase large subunit
MMLRDFSYQQAYGEAIAEKYKRQAQAQPTQAGAGEWQPPVDTINPVYHSHIDNLSRVQIFFGGSSSGKSVFLAQRDVIRLMRGGRNFLVCRQVGRTLRGSVIQEVKSVISEWGLDDYFSINKTDGTVTHRNGYQIVFAGLDDVQKLKSIRPIKGAFTDVRVEEATETERQTVKQLFKRQRGGDPNTKKCITLSFNPILQINWIYQEYFKSISWADDQREFSSEDLSILKTTYKDNQFLTPDDIKDLESETDKYYRDVYTLGKWGVLGNVIFTNWRMEDLSKMRDQFTNRRNGLDFGFSSNPAALHRSHYDRMRKKIYVFGELYETELTNDILAQRLIDKIGKDAIKCDSAEPKSIKELRNYGVNAYGARKGKDSVQHGIQWLKQQEIILDLSCVNARNELMTYHYKEDASGNATETPVDKDNHWIDATRYAYEDDMEKRTVRRGASPFDDFRG